MQINSEGFARPIGQLIDQIAELMLGRIEGGRPHGEFDAQMGAQALMWSVHSRIVPTACEIPVAVSCARCFRDFLEAQRCKRFGHLLFQIGKMLP